MEQLLAGLNPQQREAVLSTEGPLLILAGAGSGKTRVLTHRIAWLLHQGVSPFHILAITFTNKAAGEMKERVEQLVGPAARDIWVSTFHAACVRILRRELDKTGFSSKFVIMDTADQLAVIKECLRDLNMSDKQFHPSAVLGAISNAKNELLGPSAYAARARDWFGQQVASVYRLYQEKLAAQNGLDFDDLIMKTVELFRTDADVLDYYQHKFRYIMVDEYQDTNHAQYEFVRLLASSHRNLCVVGDDDQSIYGWRGADIRNILDFEKDYPEAKIVKLEQNYRSTQHILNAANSVVQRNVGRKEKRLWTDRGAGERISVYEADSAEGEAWYIANEIERRQATEGKNLRDFAILYRTHAMSRVIEDIFMRRQIPYVIFGGLRFYERKEIKDALAYLRLVHNPYDIISFRRVVNTPKRGLGPASVERVELFAAGQGLSVIAAAARAAEAGLGPAQARKMQQFAEMIMAAAELAPTLGVAETLKQILEASGYRRELLAENTTEAQVRLENLDELLSVAAEFDQASAGLTEEQLAAAGLTPDDIGLGGFLSGVALVADVDQAETERDAVVLMTLHSAKGLEFPVVFLVGMEEGVFPHIRALTDEEQLSEERRLCYVGMTRAQEKLYLTRALARMVHGQTMYNRPSRFWEEIDPECLDEAVTGGFGNGLGGAGSYGSGYGHSQRAGAGARFAVGAQTDFGRSVSSDAAGAGGQPLLRQPRPAANRGPVLTDLAAGDRVVHPKWGEGTVVSTHGEGEDAEITLAFPGLGVKRVIARYAGLRRAD